MNDGGGGQYTTKSQLMCPELEKEVIGLLVFTAVSWEINSQEKERIVL